MEATEAAGIVIETIMAMAQEGKPLMLRVLPAGDIHFWHHYPGNDARDAQTQSRWYYHVHPPGDRDPAEHGHFHLFLHRSQIDPSAELIAMPRAGEQAEAHVTHVAGLSIDKSGIPITWFVTNRWVTEEFLYPAETMIAHLTDYDVDNTAEDGLVNRFVTAMVALYREELAQLLRQRDARQAELVAEHGTAAYDSGNDVLAALPIDLDAKIESLGLA